MSKFIFLFLASFLILLNSCSKTCREWQLQDVSGTCAYGATSRIYLSPENSYRGLGLELRMESNGVRMYVNAYSVPFSTLESDPGQALMLIGVNEDIFEFQADVLQGGQRLLVPDEAVSLIITSLSQNIPIKITVGRYCATIVPDNFLFLYNDFRHR